MTNPNDSTAYPGQPQPGGPPGQPPYAPPPVAPRKSSALLYGVIGVLALVIVVGAILVFTGVFDRRSPTNASVALGTAPATAPTPSGTPAPAASSGPSLNVTQANIAGVWAENCGAPGSATNLKNEFRPDGSWWSGENRTAPAGTYTISGTQITTTYAGNSTPMSAWTVNHLAADTMQVTIPTMTVQEHTFRRCSGPTAGAAPPAAQARMSETELQAYLQQLAGLMATRVPMPAGPITIQSVSADGFVLSVRATVPTNDWTSLRSQLAPAVCASPAGPAIRSGARISIEMLHEASGSTNRVTVSSC